MKKQNNVEFQAIMNLLYIGDDQQPGSFHQTVARREFGVLNDHHNKIKSNTIHLRTTKKSNRNANSKVQSLEQSLDYRARSSQNKENLKNILKKLENSPSPPTKKKQLLRDLQFDRIQTQISQPTSKSKSKYPQNKSLQMTKKSLNKFFDKKKDKDLIKSLIKAKIVQKMRKVQTKKSEKKVYNLGIRTGTMRYGESRMLNQQRPSALKSQKSKSRSNFMNLLWQQKKINNPVLSRKSSKVMLKQLIF